ncbi:MAG: DUF1573 domain-containing protein [Candidatus Zixiibacteriota bacterium]
MPRAAVHMKIRDFGYLPQKSEVSHRFYINNEGTEPLVITKIKPGCSCTSVTKIEKPIPPGDSAAIDVTFKTGRYHQQVRKTTYVLTDDHKRPELTLNIQAYIYQNNEVAGPVMLTPNKLTIRKTDDRYSFENGTVTVTNESADTLKVTVKYLPDKYIALESFPEWLAPGQTASIRLSVRENAIDENISGLACTLAFSATDTTLVTVPLEIN